MFSSSSVYTTSDGESSQQQSSSEIFSTQQQQDGSEQQLPKNNRFEEEEGAGGKQVLRAVWDTRSDLLATASRPSSSSDGQPQTGGGKTKRVDEASQTDSKRFKGKENFLAGKIGRGKLLTLLDAMNYCRSLLEDQLERAKEQRPAINESINGDAHAKKTLITLLPDQSVRLLFIEIIRNGQAWQRIRPLFGAPPYHFLKPEDAGLLRAGASRRAVPTWHTTKSMKRPVTHNSARVTLWTTTLESIALLCQRNPTRTTICHATSSK